MFLQVDSYYVGMEQDDRTRVQDNFMENKKGGLVVATIAFEMGLDHLSIRYLYHYNIPKTPDGYIQEIRRE